MEQFNFYSPTEFVFGQGREAEAGKYVRKYGGSKVLVHFGGSSAKKSGLLDRVFEALTKEGLEYVYPTNVMRFCEVATRVWGIQMDFEHPEKTAMAGITAFKNFLSGIGMPVSFKEIGAKKEDIPTLVDKLGIGDGTRAGFKTLDRNDVIAIYELAARE